MASSSPQLKARCEELKLDWSTLSLENLLKEKQALRTQISEKQRHCLELQVGVSAAEGPALPGRCCRPPLLGCPAPGPGRLSWYWEAAWSVWMCLALEGEQRAWQPRGPACSKASQAPRKPSISPEPLSESPVKPP